MPPPRLHPKLLPPGRRTSLRFLQRFDVRQVPYVPDAGHSQLIERVLGAPSMRAVPLTTEEEGWRYWLAPGPAASAASC